MAGGNVMFEHPPAGLAIMAALMAALLAGSATAATPASAQALEGSWAGDRLQLVIDAGGGRVQMDCASGTIAGPIGLAANGTFIAAGTFLPQQAGPQRADEGLAPPGARYSGEVKDDAMRLSILAAGASTPQMFTLRRGATVKLIRCL